jgi:hypothetical protein
MGVSRTALVTLGGSGWLVPSQAAVSGVAVAASFLAVGGVLWAAVAIAAGNLLGALIRWLGLRSLGHLPDREWLSMAAWKGDIRWMSSAIKRKAG